MSDEELDVDLSIASNARTLVRLWVASNARTLVGLWAGDISISRV